MTGRPIVVAGAGSIGCFVGGMSAAAGRRVRLLARPRVIAGDRKQSGSPLTSFEGSVRQVAPRQLTLSDDPRIFADAGVVLVTVKSADTAEIADAIARHAPRDAVIVSLQNGVGNVGGVAPAIAGADGARGMVPFNVIALGEGRFHRATSGDIVIEQRSMPIPRRGFRCRGLTMRATDDIAGVQWGKLLVNLNNAINALSGLPLREQLAQRDWRSAVRRSDRRRAGGGAGRKGIRPVSPTPVPAELDAASAAAA